MEAVEEVVPVPVPVPVPVEEPVRVPVPVDQGGGAVGQMMLPCPIIDDYRHQLVPAAIPPLEEGADEGGNGAYAELGQLSLDAGLRSSLYVLPGQGSPFCHLTEEARYYMDYCAHSPSPTPPARAVC